jgi:hypothetical protein
VQGYTLRDSIVTIEDPNDKSLVFDLSGDPILRNFKFCVSPGQGGGDSRPFCENDTDVCKLN